MKVFTLFERHNIIAQIASASVSFVASCTITVTILRSLGGLGTPYRRLFFGLTLSDIIQSISLIVGPFAIPVSHKSPWGYGNAATCTANGFFLMVAATNSPMYGYAICYYYLCKIKRNISNEEFRRLIEWKIHLMIWGISVPTSFAGVLTDSINASAYGNMCTYATVPADCRQNRESYDECEGEVKQVFFEIMQVTVTMACLLGIACSIALTYLHAIGRDRTLLGTPKTKIMTKNTSNLPTGRHLSIQVGAIHAQPNPPLPDVTRLRISLRREMRHQCCLYVAAILVTHVPLWIGIARFSNGNTISPSLLMLISVLYPLGGMINVYVYTRPSVITLRRRCPDSTSWLKHVILVIAAGGNVPHDNISREDDNHDSHMKFLQKKFVAEILESSKPQSNAGGDVKDPDSADITQRLESEWVYVKGGMSRMPVIYEDDNSLGGSSDISKGVDKTRINTIFTETLNKTMELKTRQFYN